MRHFARFGTICTVWKMCPWRSVTFSKVAGWDTFTIYAEACNVTKSNTPSWAFFHISYIAQIIPNRVNHHHETRVAEESSISLITDFTSFETVNHELLVNFKGILNEKAAMEKVLLSIANDINS